MPRACNFRSRCLRWTGALRARTPSAVSGTSLAGVPVRLPRAGRLYLEHLPGGSKAKNAGGVWGAGPPIHPHQTARSHQFLEKAADILRGNVDHSEFSGYVFALLFFKRIGDVFVEELRRLQEEQCFGDHALWLMTP